MKPNPKAIAALKRVMTKEQRQLFVDNCIKYKGESFEDKWNKEGMTIYGNYNYLFASYCSFVWDSSPQGHDYWNKILGKLKKKEQSIELFIK